MTPAFLRASWEAQLRTFRPPNRELDQNTRPSGPAIISFAGTREDSFGTSIPSFISLHVFADGAPAARFFRACLGRTVPQKHPTRSFAFTPRHSNLTLYDRVVSFLPRATGMCTPREILAYAPEQSGITFGNRATADSAGDGTTFGAIYIRRRRSQPLVAGQRFRRV